MESGLVHPAMQGVELEGAADALQLVQVENARFGGVHQVEEFAAETQLSAPHHSHGGRLEAPLGVKTAHFRERGAELELRRVQHPGVVEYLLDGKALPGVYNEHLGHKVNSFPGYVLPLLAVELVCAGANLFEELTHVVVVEGRVADEQDVEDDSHGPHVARRAVERPAGLDGNHLGCHIVGRAHHGLVDVRPVHDHGQAKVGDLDLRVVVLAGEDEVLGLEVAVQNARLVERLNGEHDTPHERGSVALGVALASDDAVKELLAFEHLHDNGQAVLLTDDVADSDEVVGVLAVADDLLHDQDLVVEDALLAAALVLHEVGELDHLDGDHFAGEA
mmetsp:Transcript_13972/g.44731  ORF Transcript_13972/g.44731 Transcript_13972/m.44731 type:complete len:334 (-) Transcript_13972:282-1283(-)